MESSSETRVANRARSAVPFAHVFAGRIVQVRLGQLDRLTDVAHFTAAVFSALYAAGPGAVIYADYRGGTPVSGEVSTSWSRAMRRTNASIAKSAILLDPSNAIFNLQVERVVYCAGSEDRRLFKNADELCDWLDGTLTETERVALRTLVYPYAV